MPETQINPTAVALLVLLHEGPMTGGQLMAAAERRLGPYWSMTRSQVYRELPVLAEMGFVRLGKPGPRSSQPYAITASGKRAFSRWLAESPGRDALRNPVALRVARTGRGPFSIVRHIGRKTGRTYETPVILTGSAEGLVSDLAHHPFTVGESAAVAEDIRHR